MSLAEKIFEKLERLPEPKQAEVLDFVEFLASKQGSAVADAEDQAWSSFSLAQALRGMEDEADLYSEADLKERYS